MGTELTVSEAMDLSHYEPGDVLCIPRSQIAKHGLAGTFIALAALSKAAGRVGLLIETEMDDAKDEVRIVFK